MAKHESPENPATTALGANQSKSFAAYRAAWALAFAGLAVPAVVRFLSAPADGSRTLWAVIGGIALSIVLFQLLVVAVAIPRILRSRALRALRPGRPQVEVVAFDSDIAKFAALSGKKLQSHERGVYTVTFTDDELELWSGVRSPSIIASIPRQWIVGVEQKLVTLPLRRAWGVTFALSAPGLEDKIDLVPMSGAGGALGAKRVGDLVGDVGRWLADSPPG